MSKNIIFGLGVALALSLAPSFASAGWDYDKPAQNSGWDQSGGYGGQPQQQQTGGYGGNSGGGWQQNQGGGYGGGNDWQPPKKHYPKHDDQYGEYKPKHKTCGYGGCKPHKQYNDYDNGGYGGGNGGWQHQSGGYGGGNSGYGGGKGW